MITVARSADEWVKKFGDLKERTVITVGNFDGVHLGHQRILQAVDDYYTLHANLYERPEFLIPAVLTFYPHPARVVRPEKAPVLLMTLEQRLAAIENSGMHAALVLKFDRELSQVKAEDFARRYLVETLRTKAVYVGENFRFGHQQGGDVNMLREWGRRWDFEVRSLLR